MVDSAVNGQAAAPPQAAIDRFHDIVANALLARSEFFQKFFDPRRNIDAECGYPATGSLNLDGQFSYKELFDREPIPNRIVQLMPKECWSIHPRVYANPDPEKDEPFDEDCKELRVTLRGETSWFGGQQGDPLWSICERFDVQSGLGRFGLLLIGIDDGKDLSTPADGVVSKQPTTNAAGYKTTAQKSVPGPDLTTNKGQFKDVNNFEGLEGFLQTEYPSTKPSSKKRKLMYLHPYPEHLVQVVQYEANPQNPRFGKPVKYRVTLNDPRSAHTGIGFSLSTVQVHWSRCLHFADNLGQSDVFGVPRMEPNLNRVLDLRKLYGGSAEMYWRGALPGISFETDPKLGGDVTYDKGQLRDQIESYMNGLQRFLALNGFTAKSLSPQVVDPKAQVDIQLEAIAIQLGCPMRVFKGSERGEQASSQDDSDWNGRVNGRCNNKLTPDMVVALHDRLIMMGVLRPPSDKYYCDWPDREALSDDQKATIGVKRTQAMAQYVSGGLEALIPPMEFLTMVLHFSDDDAKAIVEAMEENYQPEDDQPEEVTDDMLLPDGEPTENVWSEEAREAALQARLAKLKAVHEDVGSHSYEQIDQHVHEQTHDLSSGDQKELAKRFGIHSGAGTGQKAVARIRQIITERKGSLDRSSFRPDESLGKHVELKQPMAVYHWSDTEPRISTQEHRLFPGTISTSPDSGSLASVYGTKHELELPKGTKLLKVGRKEWNAAVDKFGGHLSNKEIGAKLAEHAKQKGYDGIHIAASVSGFNEVAMFKVPPRKA